MSELAKLPAPMELAGLKSRLHRAKSLEARAGAAGSRVDAALDVIETGVSTLEAHAPVLEKYGADLQGVIAGMSEPSNGAPDEEPELPLPSAASGGPRFHNPEV